ncbi:MAG: hypothetical protein OEW79_04325 [Betaproteobacteria bacterium]|jgi:hypothetical protein|nr:hypothetical protein [Betaproteobacteria bacterium]MDH4293825.1 hypothetical protein [Betaproteobacteria bacterium]MDH5342040.1 hypothetical protein [Betaproteobacteria bacterium]
MPVWLMHECACEERKASARYVAVRRANFGNESELQRFIEANSQGGRIKR